MNYLEITGALVGLIYLWLEYRASIYLWIAGIIMPAIYIFVYYQAGLYADFGINIYYLLAAAYGGFSLIPMNTRLTDAEKQARLLDLDAGKRKRDPGRAAHHAHTLEKIPPPIAGIPSSLLRHRLDTDPVYGQQRPLARLVHHGAEHHRHVDAGTQVRRTVVGMDRSRRGMLRTLHL